MIRNMFFRTARYFYRWVTLPQRVAVVHDNINDLIRRLNGLERAARSSYLGDHLALTVTRNGYKMYVDTRDRGVGNCILIDGFWEESITQVIRDLCKPGMQVLEVGANLGYYTVQTADLVGSDGKVWAFEANPDVAHLLRLNLFANGLSKRGEVITKAAYDKVGEATFYVYDEGQGSSSLGKIDMGEQGLPSAQSRTIQVPLIPVDDVIPPEVMISIAKIDAEGSEPFVIDGMRKVIERNRDLVIIMEFMPGNLRSTGCEPHTFLKTLVDLGFSLMCITDEGRIVPITEADILASAQTELFLKRNQQ